MVKAVLWAGVLAAALPGCSFNLPRGECDGNGQCVPDGDVDSSLPEFCYGATAGLVKPCFAEQPTGELDLPVDIDTDSSSLCTQTIRGGDAYCVIAATTIRADEIVRASGSKPLVLVATDSIRIEATLDAASHRSADAPYTTVKAGPGALSGTCNAGTEPGDRAGGAGGSLIGSGGTGGNGGSAGAGNGGSPGAVVAVTTLRGGCAGQSGKTGTPGNGGKGGGAVYLIAGTSITITESINACGEGGHPGISGNAGAGGGGSGGMIGLDAPTITNDSAVFANGASGGEGSSSTTAGKAGPEPEGPQPSAAAQGNTNSGGDGGGGSGTGTTDGGPGRDGIPGGGSLGGGGGGGGGIGLIKVYGTVSGVGAFSPPPS